MSYYYTALEMSIISNIIVTLQRWVNGTDHRAVMRSFSVKLELVF